MCDMSWWTKKFVLSTRDGQKSETFKVPPRYMSAELERAGKVNTTLHIDAVLETLEPRCQDDGQPVGHEKALQLNLLINRRPPDEWAEMLSVLHADTDRYRYEDFQIEGYPDFVFKKVILLRETDILASQSRKRAPTATYGYIPAIPVKDMGVPAYVRFECLATVDMKSIDVCRATFLYNEDIAVLATFPASRLSDIKHVYTSANSLIKRFHVE